MADVDTSIYKQQPVNPLTTAGSAVNLLNGIQQNRLLQQAETIRNFDLGKAQMDTLIGALGPLVTQEGVTKPVALGTAASVARALRIPPQVANNIMQPLIDAPDAKTGLTAMFARLAGAGAGQPVTGPAQPGTFAPTARPLTQAAAGGPVVTAAGPGTNAALTTAGGAAGGLLGSSATEQADYRRQTTPLEQAIPALERLGATGTGPGKDEINQMKSIAISFGFAPKNWTGSVKDFDEAKKYLIDNARQLGNTSTNDQLAASFSANPSTKMSNAAAVDVAKTLLALRRMKYMQLQEFYNSGKAPEEFPKFASQWNAAHDPRAFGWDHMTPEQRKAVWKSLPAKKRDMFKLDVQRADEAGVLTNQPAQ